MAESQFQVELIYNGSVLKIKFKNSSMEHKQTVYIYIYINYIINLIFLNRMK